MFIVQIMIKNLDYMLDVLKIKPLRVLSALSGKFFYVCITPVLNFFISGLLFTSPMQ